MLVAEAKQEASELRLDYAECSALTQEGVKNVFATAIRSVLSYQQSRQKAGFRSRLSGFVSRSKPCKSNSCEPEPPIMPPAGLSGCLMLNILTKNLDFVVKIHIK